jgi:YqjK-like protein
MNEKMFELKQSRGELLARIAAQREQMTEIGMHWRIPLALADEGVAAVRFLRCHPLLVAGVVAFSVIRHRGAAGLVSGVWLVWKGYRYFTFFSARLSPRG